MKKTIRFEIEVTLDEGVEQQAIHVAREHYHEAGHVTAPLDDKGNRWREVPAEEFIPDAEAAVMELIGANDLLEKAGVEVTAVSGLETQRQELHPQDASESGLDEFENGVYLCRWPNGDFSLVTANTRREALVQLDEWAGAHPSQLFPVDSCMADFRLNDMGEIELGLERRLRSSYGKLVTQSFVRFYRMWRLTMAVNIPQKQRSRFAKPFSMNALDYGRTSRNALKRKRNLGGLCKGHSER